MCHSWRSFDDKRFAPSFVKDVLNWSNWACFINQTSYPFANIVESLTSNTHETRKHPWFKNNWALCSNKKEDMKYWRQVFKSYYHNGLFDIHNLEIECRSLLDRRVPIVCTSESEFPGHVCYTLTKSQTTGYLLLVHNYPKQLRLSQQKIGHGRLTAHAYILYLCYFEILFCYDMLKEKNIVVPALNVST